MEFITKYNKVILGIIFIIAVFLRFYSIASNPPSLTWDEAAWGYNAYTLGIDGKDEFGKFLPVTYLESFGDFKPPLYAYLSIIPVKLFGLNEFSTRFASAFFGSLSILLTYFLVKQLFNSFSKTQKQKEGEIIALLAASLLAISPWHILLSRAAFEANVASFFIIFGVYSFLAGLAKRKWLLILSILSFVLSMYTFNTARIVCPLLIVGLCLLNVRELWKIKRYFITAILVGFIIGFPLLLFLRTPQAQLRFAEVNIFSDIGVIERVNQEAKNADNSLLSKIVYNRRFAYGVEYVRHFFDNLNPQFLFIKGDGNPKFSTQDVGQMYIWELAFFLAGLFLLAKYNKKLFGFLLFWLLVGIIPAGTARETPHALRIETTVPTFQIFTAVGIFYFLKLVAALKYQVGRIRIRYVLYVIFLLCVLFNFLYFFHNYFIHYPRQYSGEWQYGYKDAIEYIEENKNKYDKIYFTEALGRPYIYFLFYQQYNPESFRKNATVDREALGFVHVRDYDKYIFAETMKKGSESRSLFIDTPGLVPGSANIVKTFYLLNGNPVLVAYE